MFFPRESETKFCRESETKFCRESEKKFSRESETKFCRESKTKFYRESETQFVRKLTPYSIPREKKEKILFRLKQLSVCLIHRRMKNSRF